MKNEVIIGDCAEVLKQFPDESIDCVVTDPPYGYSFMNLSWDKALPSLEALKECNRVLKSGAFGFFMCAPRQDVLSRMIIRLEDAGFNTNFSSILWAYACLSSDSEVLTKSGWVSYNQLRNTNRDIYKQLHILTYDIESSTYKWDIPSMWSEYQIEDTCYRIKCDYTDQLVTRNHRVLVEREGELLFRFAETLGQEINVPCVENLQMLFDSLSDIPFCFKEDNSTGCRELLFDKLQAESEHSKISSSTQRQIQNRRSILDGREKERMVGEDDRREQLGLERWSYLHKQTRKLSNESNKVCEVSRRVSSDGSPRWMGSYSPSDSSSTDRQTIDEKGSSSPRRPQSGEQQFRESNPLCEQPRPQEIRGRAGYKTCLAKVEPEFYRGIVFCPTVKTGCFVARRNGHIFLTGNSGFPKSMSISKAIDKRLGAEREIIGEKRTPDGKKYSDRTPNSNGEYNEKCAHNSLSGKTKHNVLLTAPATDKAKEFSGAFASFQPKPALEVIITCMKPLSEKTYVDQALKNGHGVSWLDSCRIPYENDTPKPTTRGSPIAQRTTETSITGWNREDYNGDYTPNSEGRFPANLLCSDNCLDNGIITKSTGGEPNHEKSEHGNKKYFGGGIHKSGRHHNDSGSFSRYFSLDAWFDKKLQELPEHIQKTFPFLITPKPSKSEKNKYIENKHPTVKPLKLMSYLITLGSREGDVILDPFAGSGTTLEACKLLNRVFIGIDKDPENEKYMVARGQLNTSTISDFTEEARS